MKKVLHLSSDFLYTALYNQLFESLSPNTQEQVVYSAVKVNSVGLKFSSNKYTSKVSPILNLTDKFFFRKRIAKVYNDVLSKFEVFDFDIVHAHFLFTDGAIALKLNEKFNIPYVVAIRNTDLNIYFKYFWHLRGLAYKILANAQKIILISPKYESEVMNFFSESQVTRLREKIIVVPNGINNFWLEGGIKPKVKSNFKKLSFLFVGEIALNKNLKQAISLLKKLSAKYSIDFTIIGKKLDGYEELSTLLNEHDWLKYLDPIKDKDILREYYRNADIFIMLSKYETFGLVYVESLSQGTPIIYTKGQGIDGYFPEGSVGYSFDIAKSSFEEFEQKIESIMKNYEIMSYNSILESRKFNWADISNKYVSIYED